MSKAKNEPQESGLLGNGPHGVSFIQIDATAAQLARLEALNQCHICRVPQLHFFYIISQPRMSSKTLNFMMFCKECGDRLQEAVRGLQ